MSLHKNFGSQVAKNHAASDETPVAPTSTPSTTPDSSTSTSQGVVRSATPRGIISPPKRPAKGPALLTGSLRDRKSVILPPLQKRPALPSSPLARRNKPLPEDLKEELRDVRWKETQLPEGGIDPKVEATNWKPNPAVPQTEPSQEQAFDATAYDIDPNAADPYHRIKKANLVEHFVANVEPYVKKEIPEFMNPTPPNPSDLVPPVAPSSQDTPPVARRAIEDKPAAENANQPQGEAEVKRGGTVRRAMQNLKNLLADASKPAAKPAARPIASSESRVSDGNASMSRRENYANVCDLENPGAVQTRIDTMRRRTPVTSEALIKIHHVIPEATEALVPEASTTFFGNLFGCWDNKWKNVNEENFVEMLGKILQASEELSKQSKTLNSGTTYFGLTMGIIAFVLFMTRELINKIQNNYSTDKTIPNIVLDYSVLVILFVTVFGMVGINEASRRSRAAAEEASQNANELRLWGKTHLRIQPTDEEIIESRKRSGKAI